MSSVVYSMEENTLLMFSKHLLQEKRKDGVSYVIQCNIVSNRNVDMQFFILFFVKFEQSGMNETTNINHVYHF